MDTRTRADINRALAKAIAYKDCGKEADSQLWTAILVDLLGRADLLNDSGRSAVQYATASALI